MKCEIIYSAVFLREAPLIEMSLTLYYNDVHSESRAVLLVSKALNINLTLEEIDTCGREICGEVTNVSTYFKY